MEDIWILETGVPGVLLIGILETGVPGVLLIGPGILETGSGVLLAETGVPGMLRILTGGILLGVDLRLRSDNLAIGVSPVGELLRLRFISS